ncbi:MAG: tyrosine-type recombinase/integrase [Pseudomonadota bacterium]
MGRVKLQYVHVWKHSRSGITYCHFRYKGTKTRLPLPDDPAFGEAYAKCLRTIAGVASAAPSAAGHTLDWLVNQYQRSPEYKRLAPRTQHDYCALLSAVTDMVGESPFKTANRKVITELVRDPLEATPRRADAAVAALSSVYRWAMSRDLVKQNPCVGIGKLYRSGEGYRAWTADEIARFIDVCSDWEWLVFCLGLYTTFRPGDLVKLTWFQYDGTKFKVRQSKTKKPIVVTAHPVLRQLLAAMPRTEGTIITRPNGERYRDATALSGRWSKAMRRHGLAGCTVHGLRTTGATVLAEAGATDAQLQSVTGHTTRAMVSHYTRGAEQERLNEESVAMLPTLKRGH